MKANIVGLSLALVALLAASAGRAQERGETSKQLGQAHLPVSCSAEAQRQFDRAVAAGEKDLERLHDLRAALLEANQGYWADQVEVQRRAVAAWLARAAGRSEEAVELGCSAAALESASEKHPVKPGPILPARELLGELLLELGRPAAALVEFEASIEKEPNRFNGLYGAARAAELMGDRERARTFYTKLVALCEQADGERPGLEQAKVFLAKR
jgi:tetratricopeptide (TPR) repeat protein